jgi:ferredoxin--NADP+ reductase
VVVATGSAVDRRLGVPGEDLHGSHPATAFVGWYNAHPDFAGESFDLGTERAVVVGVGNVALDVTRVLIRNPEELAPTDVAGYALDALRKSSVREVVVLGRRGPAQAAFDLSELIDIVELDGVEVVADPSQIDPESASDPRLDRAAKKKVAYLAELAKRHPSPSAGLLGPGQRRVRLEFLCSPLEIIGNEGRVESMRVERNRLVASNGDYKARGTGEIFSIETGLVFRSIGYHGVIVPGLPFDAQRGVIPNLEGRVTDETGQLVPRVYVVGWIKRGPTGVIGTNKPDAQQTVRHMLADAEALDLTYDDQKTRAAMDVLLESRGVVIADYLAWRRLDDLEKAAGLGLGKVREKFSSVRAMLEALARK